MRTFFTVIEGIRYRRHTSYAGVCNWCLTMATREAIYKTATSAVKGHDNCKCIAVPERKGTSYTMPAMVRDAESVTSQRDSSLRLKVYRARRTR